MITVGGLGSLPGAVLGAVLLVVVPEYLRDFREYKMLAYGILLVLSMTFLPRGLAGVAANLAARYGREDAKSPYRFYFEQMRAKMKKGNRLYVFKSTKDQTEDEITHDWVMVFSLRDGKITRNDHYYDSADILAAFR